MVSAGPSESLLPAKPPLRVEEGLIEVGWDSANEENEATTTAFEEEPDEHQPIDDHYAALQAWDEWARNQGRGASRRDPDVEGEPSHDDYPEIESGAPEGRWADVGQSFGPYSQLFSRVRRLEEAE
jgi:general secretion pathway protein A